MKKAIALLVMMVGVVGCDSAQVHKAATDDRSFYQEIDKNAWPGDTLSKSQTVRAIKHFQDAEACRKPWSWALIGPDVFLLKGTDYLVERHLTAITPNIGWSKGYWGGVPLLNASVTEVKIIVERMARDDCKYQHKEPK